MPRASARHTPALTPDQQAEADRLFAVLQAAAAADLRALADQLATTTDKTIFGANEFAVRDIVLGIGAKALEAALEGRKRGYRGSSRACPGCGGDAKFQRWQHKTVTTLIGDLRVDRAYYYCPTCGTGGCPRDADLHLDASRQTLGARQVIALAGTTAGFAAGAAKVLAKLTGLRLSASTVQRTTEAAGADLGERIDRGDTFGPATAWDWTTDATGRTVAYVGADLTGVPMQAADAGRADGRMAAVGMIWNARRGAAGGQARYLAGLTDRLAAMGEPLRRQGSQVGMDRADRWVAIADGGAGLEDWLRAHFPRVEAVILDFYHASTYLHDGAKAWHPGDAAAAERLAGSWCHWLKHEGGAAVLGLLRGCDVTGESAAVREEHRRVVGYFEHQAHRMDYPTYRANGWQIGSGPVEAACKQVVNERLKVTGARWREAGADAVCRLRALYRSEPAQWDAYWAAVAA